MDEKEQAQIIIGKLMNIGGMLQKKANQLLSPFGLNQQQFSLLFEIFKAGRVNQKTMVNRLMLEKAHVSKIIKKLHSMGLIGIVPSTDDKRSSWLSITEKGKDVVEGCRKALGEWNGAWITSLAGGERMKMVDSLSLLQSSLRDAIQDK